MSLRDLAILYASQDDWGEVRSCVDEGLPLMRTSLPPNHPWIAECVELQARARQHFHSH